MPDLQTWHYVLGASLALFVVWFFSPSWRKKQAYSGNESVDESVWLILAGDDELPFFQRCKRNKEGHIVGPDGTRYPADFVHPMGRESYFVATRFLVPADGNMAHGGSYADLVPVKQPAFLAHWRDADRARRNLNWASVWVPGDGTATILKNCAYAALVVIALWGAWSSWGTSSQVARLADSIPRMQAQLELGTGVGANDRQVDRALRSGTLGTVSPGPAQGDEAK